MLSLLFQQGFSALAKFAPRAHEIVGEQGTLGTYEVLLGLLSVTTISTSSHPSSCAPGDSDMPSGLAEPRAAFRYFKKSSVLFRVAPVPALIAPASALCFIIPQKANNKPLNKVAIPTTKVSKKTLKALVSRQARYMP